jgi:hypothetical protein
MKERHDLNLEVLRDFFGEVRMYTGPMLYHDNKRPPGQ